MQYQFTSSSLFGGINTREALSEDQCSDRDDSEYPIRVVEMSDNGFLGVYAPNETQVISWLSSNVKGNITGNVTSDSYNSGRRRLLATSTVPGSIFSGILNPVTCLEYGEYMMFSVSSTNYPVYDKLV